MSRRQPDLESGISRSSTGETGKAGIAFKENGNSYFGMATQPDPELDAPFLQELRDAIDCLEAAYNPDVNPSIRKRKGKDNFFSWVKRRKPPIRYAFYLAPLVALLVIPLAVLSTVFSGRAFIDTIIDPPTKPANDTGVPGWPTGGTASVHAAGLLVWLEIVVVALWAASSLSWLSTTTFGWGCDFFKERLRHRELLFDALKNISTNLMALPVTLVLWTIISFATTPAVCVFDDDTQCVKSTGWIYIVNRVFEAGIVVSFLFWVERLVIGMSFISYYGKQYDSKHSVLQSDINLIKNLFYLTLHRPSNHHHKLVSQPATTCQDCKRAGTIARCLRPWKNDWNLVFDNAISHEETAMHLGTYLWYSIKLDETDLSMVTSNDEAKKKLKEDILTGYLKDWITRDRENFSDDIKKRMFDHPKGEEGNDAITKEYTDILNGDNDDDVTYGEMHTAIKRLGRRVENLEKTLHNVREAMESLDRPLLVIVLIAVAFVYAAFFVNNFNSYATAIFTAFTGLGFALSGTVTDFLTSCIFLFVKHPYYVGDRISINQIDLEVDRISLMTTKFTRIDNRKFVQLPHSLLNTYWIENLTRSKRLKEYFTIAVSPDTDFSTIDEIRDDLNRFVARNARDFKKDSLRIELFSINDLTQMKLEVEVEHKFKYFDDDIHADRQTRFRTALLTFIRDRQVLPPNVDPIAMGDPWRPTYNITSDAGQLAQSRLEFEDSQTKLRRRRTAEAEHFRMAPPPKRSHAGTPLLTPTLR